MGFSLGFRLIQGFIRLTKQIFKRKVAAAYIDGADAAADRKAAGFQALFI